MILTDTGPIVAIMDRADEDHELCVAALTGLRGPMTTTWPALTEAMHLIGARAGWKAQDTLLGLVNRGDVVLEDLKQADVDRCRELMAKYRSLPMDLADASIVVVAERLRTRRVFTLDSDFRVYRIQGRQSFDIVPAI